MTDNRITLSADTKCFKCGGSLLEGQTARWEFDTAINGYVHRHTRSGLCHRRNRDVDHLEVMEAIHGIISTEEGIPDRTDVEEIRPDANGLQNDARSTKRHLSNLRKSSVNRTMGN